MKNIFCILLIVLTHQLRAQDIIPYEELKNIDAYQRSGKYFKDVNGVFDKFIGNWKYQDNPNNPSKILEVTFYKIENQSFSGYFEDYLYAHYRYYENGVEIYNTENLGEYFIYGGQFRDPQNTNKYNMIYSEPNEIPWTLGKSFNIEYLSNNGGIPQLKWDVEVLFINSENAILPIIPKHIILTKQP